MTGVGALALGVAGALLVGAALALRARRRRRVAARRAAAVARLAHSIERVALELDRQPFLHEDRRDRVGGAPAPLDPTTGLPARAALVDALVAHVAQARRDAARLALAVVSVDASGVGLEAVVAELARATRRAAPDGEVFRVGERALALVLPAAGRADAISALARVEASLTGGAPLRSTAVELGPGEDAAGLLARALG